MINYNNGKIYKLEPNCEYDEGDIYIGSTTKRLLCQRMATHRLEYRKWKDGLFPKYTCFDIFDKYGIDNIKIVLLELVSSNTCSLDELNAKESEYIKNTKCLNKPIPIRPKFHFEYNKERFIKRNKEQLEINEKRNKERLQAYGKLYREKNKDKIREQKKLYREKNKIK